MMSHKFVWAATLAVGLVSGGAGSASAQDLGYYLDQGSDPGYGGASVYQPFRYPRVVNRYTHQPEAYGYDRAGPSETYQIDPRYADPYDGGRAYREGGAQDYDLAEASREMTRAIVENTTRQPPGTIVIDTEARELYYTQPNGKAFRYGIGVGREGFAWHGVAAVRRKAEWPDWIPPSDMLKRRPDLPLRMAGGLDNPLGARAMYLFQGNKDTMFRIHGTNEPETIGHAVSSGCIRMMNADVIDLYKRVPVGTKVVVL